MKRFWNPASLTRTVLGGGFLILLGALALSGRSQTAWAFSFQGGAGVGAVIGGLILLGAALYIQSRGNDVSIPGIETLFVLRPGKARWVVFAIPLALMAGVLLYVFRLRLFLNPPGGLGDSLQLVQHVPAYAHIFGYLDSFDEALDLYFHSKVYLWIEKSFHGTIVDAYAWPSIGAGVVFTLVVLRFLWGRPWAHMAAGFFLLYCNTALQLYAGYVENYTFASLILSSTLLFGGQLLERAQSDDLAAEERRNPVPVWPLSLLAVAAAVGVLFHLIVGAVLPGLVYVCWRQAGGRWTDFARRALIASVPALVILGAGWIFLFKLVANPLTISGSFASHPAILHPKKILTLAHTLNYVSLYLFAAPAAILVLLVLFGRSSSNNTQARRALFRTPAERFAGMTFAVLGTHAFVWNSMIGFPADWDLFTFFQAPLNLLAFYVFTRPTEKTHTLKTATLAAVALVSLAWSLSWLGRNSQERGASRDNLENAQRVSRAVIERVNRDTAFAAVPDLERRRTWLKLELFQERARLIIARAPWSLDEKQRLTRRLERATSEYRRAALLDRVSYTEQLPAIWDELTAVNEAVTPAE